VVVLLKCSLCGVILSSRSVKDFMEHLEYEHNQELVEYCERRFFTRVRTHIDKALARHNVSPFDLTEFDQWVNDATRKDVKEIAASCRVFGLKIWDYEIIEGEALRSGPVYNFSVDLLFFEDKRKLVKALMDRYKRGEMDDMKFIHQLFDEALYVCMWV